MKITDTRPGKGAGEAASNAPVDPVMHDGAYATPSEVSAEAGEVIVDGPDAVAVSLTPDAALETSQRLLEAGLMAQGQRVNSRRRARGGGEADEDGTER